MDISVLLKEDEISRIGKSAEITKQQFKPDRHDPLRILFLTGSWDKENTHFIINFWS